MIYDNNQYFESGKYEINSNIKNNIDSILIDIINENGEIISVNIESSTDKQKLSNNLKNMLIKSGFSGDNEGLSNARACGIYDYVKTKINETLINKTIKFEQGSTIDAKTRYVSIKFSYIIIEEEIKPSKTIKSDDKTIYYLSKNKPVFKKRTIDVDMSDVKIKKRHGVIKNAHKNSNTKCYDFGTGF